MKISRDWRDIWTLNFVKKYGCNDNIFSFEAGIWVPKTIECGEASGSSQSLPPLLEIVDSDNPGMKILLCNILVHAVHTMTEHASWFLIYGWRVHWPKYLFSYVSHWKGSDVVKRLNFDLIPLLINLSPFVLWMGLSRDLIWSSVPTSKCRSSCLTGG